MPQTESNQETETVSIQMPSSLMERIRARVRTGEFQSQDAAVVHAVAEHELWSELPSKPLGSLEEMLAGIPDLLDRIDCGQEKMLSPDQFQEELAAHRRAFRNA